ncbi:hypothetical protein ACFVX6_16065 [Streptomyces sp. NPDC058289]|uniref:hypothetical protein n=1 Tax=Streptomyces sp. NPDC058289 TaxID=3346425 RepID=UPI0036E429C5
MSDRPQQVLLAFRSGSADRAAARRAVASRAADPNDLGLLLDMLGLLPEADPADTGIPAEAHPELMLSACSLKCSAHPRVRRQMRLYRRRLGTTPAPAAGREPISAG